MLKSLLKSIGVVLGIAVLAIGAVIVTLSQAVIYSLPFIIVILLLRAMGVI